MDNTEMLKQILEKVTWLEERAKDYDRQLEEIDSKINISEESESILKKLEEKRNGWYVRIWKIFKRLGSYPW